MKTFKNAFYFPLLFLLFFSTYLNAAVDCFVEDSSNGAKAFKQHCLPNENNIPQDVLNIRGGVTQIGNQIICVTNNNDLGTCIDPDGHQNNDYGTRTTETAGTRNFLGNADYDDDNDTFSSSSAYLELRDNDNVLWARLQWMAQMDEDNEDNTLTSDARTIKFKTPTSGTYKDIQCDFYGTDTYNYNRVNNMTYKCSADVTDLVQESGDYWVANVDSELGLKNNYASWGLTVLYKNNNDPLVNITLYEGYEIFWNQHAYFQINGFLTPLERDVNASLFFYAAEGDYGYTDYLEISTANNTAETSDVTQDLHGGSYIRILNPMTNRTLDFANGSISTYGQNVTNRTPNYSNSLGTDIDTVLMIDQSKNQVLSNKQTSTTLHFFAYELVTMSMLGTKINLHIPQFCYDYAYKQDGVFFTEENDGTKNPRIVGTVVEDKPVEVGIYVKNRVNSDIEVTDMVLNILNIDTSQAVYERESTKITEIGSLIPNYIPDNTLDVSDSYVKGVDIGTIQSNDYFYAYYNLDPITSDLNMSLEVNMNYTLTYGGVEIPYNLLLGSEIEMCSSSNFEYKPVSGIFNIVHEDYYNNSTSYYNLPTQVTNREGNFKVISMDETNIDQLKAYPTIVAVEMIDVDGFHDIDPTCKEMGSTISEKVWVIFDDNRTSVSFGKDSLEFAIANNMTQLTNSYDFYTKARKNAAFRVSYNSMDNNNSIVNLQKDVNGNYTITNWRSEWSAQSCSKDMDNDTSTTDTVYDNCNLAIGGTLTSEDLANCMECIYGFDTKFICSRDNFSIRPEAFLINLDDQSQTNPTSQTRLTNNFSGVSSPTPDDLSLTSGYSYNIEVNATNFLGNAASDGYTKSFNFDTPNDNFEYAWEPRTGVVQGACNDENTKATNLRFLNGEVDTNTSIKQIGEYRLHILDSEWTSVDHNPEYMEHHTGSYFLDSSVPDCVPDSTVVRTNDPYPTQNILNGCNISSTHTNDNANLVYNDINVTFHPYRFDVNSIVPSIGIDFNTTINNSSFIYMADTTFNNNQDENLSYHLNGSIIAEGYDGTRLTNFVSSCYAKALNIDINNSDTTLTDVNGGAVLYQATLQNLDINGTVIAADLINVAESNHQTPMQIQLTPEHFQKDQNGSLNTRLNLNFNRANNLAVNPIRVTYDSYNVECTDPASDCTFSADLQNNKTTKGSRNLDQNITHYYGRTHAPLYNFVGPTGTGLIYYEVYCNGAGCDKTLLQDGINSRYTNDPRWFINTRHRAALGTASVITQKGARNNVSASNATGNHPDSIDFTYDASLGYPYKATMENNASRWLIYNPYNAADTTNEFDLSFSSSDSGWNGEADTSSSTSNDGAQTTNRRTMW